ncbi:hypothetical protein BGZ50_006937, partial [Haplosporangium sp. Z 11]
PVITAVAADILSVPAKRPLTTESTAKSTSESTSADTIAANEPYQDPRKRLRSTASATSTNTQVIGILKRKDSTQRKKHVLFSRRNRFKEIPPLLVEKNKEAAPEGSTDSTPVSSSESSELVAPEEPPEVIDHELEARLKDAKHKRMQVEMLAYYEPNSLVATPPIPRSSPSPAEATSQDKPKKRRRHTTLGWKALKDSRRMRRASPALPPENNVPEIHPTTTTGLPLAGHKIYLLPLNIDETFYRGVRNEVARLGGEWVGPRRKKLDARVPALNHPNVTHIVTTLRTLDGVKSFLGVEELDPKVAVVRSKWLYKSLLEGQRSRQLPDLSLGDRLHRAQGLSLGRTPPSTGWNSIGCQKRMNKVSEVIVHIAKGGQVHPSNYSNEDNKESIYSGANVGH